MKHIFTSLLLLAATVPAAFAISPKLVKVADNGYGRTSVNTAIFRVNPLVTRDSMQYISYYDADGYVTLGRRQLGSDKWELHRTAYKGNTRDGHNVISMAMDGDGYLHMAFDHHSHPLHYCRSIRPGSLEMGPLQPMTGTDENDVTYPEFYNLPDGSLMFAYRSGASGRGNLVLNRYTPSTRQWQRMHSALIDGEGARNAYWQLYVGPDGTIHISWVWRETYKVETNHDICYARSRDFGATWEHSDSTPYTLPITAANAEYAVRIPRKSELINQTSMTADTEGHPYIATYWRSEGDSVPQYRMVWNDGKGWSNTTVGKRVTPFSLSGGGTKMIPISRPRMVSDGHNVWYFYRDVESGSKVMLAQSTLGSDNWELTTLTDFPVNAWEPSLDADLWKEKGELHLFVQPAFQGDGEHTVDAAPQPVYVLEVNQ